jgi:hypothetical protein
VCLIITAVFSFVGEGWRKEVSVLQIKIQGRKGVLFALYLK